MTKLYSVEVLTTVMVAAEDAEDALWYANANMREICANEPFEAWDAVEVKAVSRDFKGTLPYGHNPMEKTCEQFVGN